MHGKIHAGAVDRVNEEYAKQDPIMAQTFLDERDQFMISINFLIHFYHLLFLVIWLFSFLYIDICQQSYEKLQPSMSLWLLLSEWPTYQESKSTGVRNIL